MKTAVLSSPIYAAFNRLLDTDPRFRKAVVRYGFFSKMAVIQTREPFTVYAKIYSLIRLIRLCGHPATQIGIHELDEMGKVCREDYHKISRLIVLRPKVLLKSDGVYDRKLTMSILEQNAARFQALASFVTANATLFGIGVDGIYKKVKVQEGVESKIAPEDMEGRSLFEVLPSEETALSILAQIKQAYEANKPRTIQYGLWDRKYESTILPSPGLEEVVLICKRLG